MAAPGYRLVRPEFAMPDYSSFETHSGAEAETWFQRGKGGARRVKHCATINRS